MRPSNFIALLSFLSETNSVSLSENLLHRFTEIYGLIALWSKKINITSNLSPDNFITENILDPVLAYNALYKFLNSSNSPNPLLAIAKRDPVCGTSRGRGSSTVCVHDPATADVGCGGGFVGFTWHLLNNEHGHLILIDSDRKKINFCREVIRKLSLKNCGVRCVPVENVHEPLADIIVTRATWDSTETRKRCSGLARSNAVFVHFCGPRAIDQNKHKYLLNYVLKPMNAVRYLSVDF